MELNRNADLVHVPAEHLVVLVGQAEQSRAELSRAKWLCCWHRTTMPSVAVPAAAAAVFHCRNPPLFRLLYEKRRR